MGIIVSFPATKPQAPTLAQQVPLEESPAELQMQFLASGRTSEDRLSDDINLNRSGLIPTELKVSFAAMLLIAGLAFLSWQLEKNEPWNQINVAPFIYGYPG